MTEKPTCGCGKQSYRTQGAAIALAVKRAQNAPSLRVYRCPKGNGWHLTKQRREP